MLSRVALTTGTLVASVRLVKAEGAPDEEAPCHHCHAKKRLRPSQLSLYNEPAAPELVYIPPPENAYTRAVSTGRKTVWEATSGMQGGIDTTKAAYITARDYLKDMTTRVQEDTGGLQRAGLITVAAFGGIVAGYRGGYIRKAVLGSAAMTTAAAVCYPNQAVDIASNGLGRVKHEALGLWDQFSTVVTQKSSPAKVGEHKPTSTEVPENEKLSKDAQIMVEKSATTPAISPNEDPGQSRPEDKDLYASHS